MEVNPTPSHSLTYVFIHHLIHYPLSRIHLDAMPVLRGHDAGWQRLHCERWMGIMGELVGLKVGWVGGGVLLVG